MSINKTYPDPLYDHIDIEEELFEKFLSHPEIIKEVIRAKNISNLGLVKHVFQSASHSKFEHHLGTYKLIRETEKRILFLNKNEIRYLKYLNFICCFGYLPLAYCTSEAVLIAANESEKFKNELLERYFKIVYEEATKYKSLYDEREKLIEKYKYKALNAWFGAYKLLKIGKSLKAKKLHKQKLCYFLIENSNKIKKAYFDYATVEYLQRDLFYTGVIKFQIPIKRVFSSSKKVLISENYREIIDSMRTTIHRQVYAHPRHISLETEIKNIIADLLIKGKISIDNLLYNSDSYLEELININNIVASMARNKTVINDYFVIAKQKISSKDKVLYNRRDISKHVSCDQDFEKDAIILSSSLESRLFSYNQFLGYNLIIEAKEKTNLFKLIKLAFNLSKFLLETKKREGINVNSFLHKYSKEILSYVFKAEVKILFDGYLIYITDYIKNNKDKSNVIEFTKQLNRLISKLNHMDHNIIGTHDITNDFIFKGKRYAFLLEYLLWSDLEDTLKLKILRIIYTLFKSIEPKDEKWQAINEEFSLFCWLFTKWVDKSDKIILCPSVRILNEEGDITHEINLIMLRLLDNKAQICLFECSKSRTEVKCLADLKKLKDLSSSFGERLTRFDYKLYFVGPNPIPVENIDGKFEYINSATINSDINEFLNDIQDE